MRSSRTVGFIALGALCVPLLVGVAVVAASPRATSTAGRQLAELSGPGDFFGFAVAISGRTAVVGAYGYAKDAGQAYVFSETASGWKKTATLRGSNTVAGDEFGNAVAISGDTIVVGAGGHADHAGAAYVFSETGSSWKQTAVLKGSNTVAGDYFGWSVAVSGKTALVGAYGHQASAGRAYVFTEAGSAWRQSAILKGSNTVGGDQFGSAVALSGTTAVLAATARAGAAGRAYVFTKKGADWTQAAMLKGSDTVAGDHFGWSVAISGSTVVVGGFHHADLAGRAYVFTKTSSGWKQVATLKGSNTVANDGFGISVAISGATAVVGASGHAGSAGRAYVFTKEGSSWKQVAQLVGHDTVAGNGLGLSVAISGTNALVGAPSAKTAGRAYLFGA
jgi:hypothetical protein